MVRTLCSFIDGNAVCTIDPSCVYKWHTFVNELNRKCSITLILKTKQFIYMSSLFYSHHKQIWDCSWCKWWLSILLIFVYHATVFYLSWDHPRSNTLFSDLSGSLSRDHPRSNTLYSDLSCYLSWDHPRSNTLYSN
jgi:hypothetical protein